MTEQKFKRVIVASTVGAVLLVLVLVFVMTYQIISLNIAKQKKAELDAQIVEYKRLIAEGEETLETRSMYWWIVQRARELGYVFVDDKLLEE